MMKKSELLFGALLVPLDFLMLLAAGFTAYGIRFAQTTTKYSPALSALPLRQYVLIVMITAVGWLVLFAWAGLYALRSTRRIIEEMRKIFLACSTGVLIIIIWFFFDPTLFVSRFIILAAYGFGMLYLMVGRLSVLLLQRMLFRRGKGVRRIALIGQGESTDAIAREIHRRPSLGYRVVMRAEEWSSRVQEKIQSLHAKGNLDELLHTNARLSVPESEEMVAFCDEHHIIFRYAATFFDTQSAHVAVQPIAGIPIIEILKTPLDGWGKIVKRLFDIIGSTVLILMTTPIMALAALAIFLDSGRPIFFTRRDDRTLSTRAGQFGKPFWYFKFRSMQPGTDSLRYHETYQGRNMRKGTPLVKIVNDPRVTRVGMVLRRFSIDELPELFLVLKGDMSLVGPRPHLPEEVEKYQRHHKRVLRIKPGVTGLAQISGRSDLDFEEEVRLDMFYIEHWALWLDLVILLKTPFILFQRRRAL